mgnify:CR=1 FL=1
MLASLTHVETGILHLPTGNNAFPDPSNCVRVYCCFVLYYFYTLRDLLQINQLVKKHPLELKTHTLIHYQHK